MAYLFGQRSLFGFWYYFPVALLIKLTLGMMGLLLVATAAFFSGRYRPTRESFFLIVPAAI